MSETPLYVIELKAYDPVVGGERTLYYANRGFSSTPSDTPADTFFAGRVSKPALARRELFAGGTTRGRSRVGYGDLVLVNGDGALDFLKDCGVDGRDVIVRRGQVGAAYPSAFKTMLVGTMAAAQVGADIVTVKLRDQQFLLDVPLQPNLFAGDNVLPDGLEGTAEDLQGKPKPRCFGRPLNVAPPCVNTSKLIYQLNDGPVAAVSVYDRGMPLSLTPHGFDYVAHGLGDFDGRSAARNGASWLWIGGWDGATATPATSKVLRFDGTTWLSSSPFANAGVEGLAYRPALLVAVSFPRGSTPAAVGAIATSGDNGATWTLRALPGGWTATEAPAFLSVRWHAALGVFVATTASGYLCTSPDGVTWTARVSGVEGTAALYDSACDGSTIIVVGADGSSNAVLRVSSNAGVMWSAGVLAGMVTTAPLFACTWADDRWFLAGGNNAVGTTYGWISTDLQTWAPRALPYTGGSYFVVGREAGYWVAGCGPGAAFAAADGDFWSAATGPALATALATFDLVEFQGRFYGTGEDGTLKGLWASAVPVTYADTSELLDDDRAPAPGSYGVCLAGGYVRLGSSPDGLVTADVTEGAAAADRTAGQIFTRLLADPISGVLVEWRSADVDALDVTAPYELGLWLFDTGNPGITTAQAVDLCAMSVGAYWFSDRTGVLRVAQLAEPAGTAVIAVTANSLLKPLERLPTTDQGAGIPTWRSVVRYARNYSVQATDVAAGVDDARRAVLVKEWQEQQAEDAAVQSRHLLAEVTVEDSLLVHAADALAEATRRQALNGVLRHRYELALALTDATVEVDLADVADLTHARFGFASGLLLRVLDWTPEVGGAVEQVTLTGWR